MLLRSTSSFANVAAVVAPALLVGGSVWSSSQPTSPACTNSHSASGVETCQRVSTMRSLSSAVYASKMPAKLLRFDASVNEPSVPRWVSLASVNSAAIVPVPAGSVASSTRLVSVGSSGSAALIRWTT